MENLDIFINAYRDFDEYPHSNEYKIITDSSIQNKDIDVIYEHDDEFLKLNKTICEFTRMFYVYKNIELKDYIWFCQYRRYFSFYDRIPNLDEIFNEYDIITAIPYKIRDRNIEGQFSSCHNIEDLDLIDSIIKKKCDSRIYNRWKIYRKMNVFFTNNMFIMKKNDFYSYMEFMLPIVREFINERGFACYDDALKYVEGNKDKYLKDFYPNNTVDYQSRMIAYIIERLTSFYITTSFIRPKMYQIKMTEAKYFKTKENETIKDDKKQRTEQNT